MVCHEEVYSAENHYELVDDPEFVATEVSPAGTRYLTYRDGRPAVLTSDGCLYVWVEQHNPGVHQWLRHNWEAALDE